MNLEKIYAYALQREREGRDFFQRHAERMSHAVAAGIFRKLVAEEERHIAYIQALLDELHDPTDVASTTELIQEGFFEGRAISERLDQTVIESMTPDVAVLRMAYLIERDFAEFYEMAAGKVKGKARSALIALAEWERGHERLFQDLHDRVFEEYTQMPWGG